MILNIFSGITARVGVILALSTFLVACDENGEFTLGQPKDTAETVATSDEDASLNPDASQPQRFVEKEVEAPEVFQKSGKALWDGRPSLGGVWVAHTDAKQPERVVIRNPANGKKVVGALFRRERSNPGPAFQLSSDAASALGVIAGSPQELSVTALRTKKVAVEPLINLGKKQDKDAEPAPAPETVASTALPAAEKGATATPATAGTGTSTLQKPLPRPKGTATAAVTPKPTVPKPAAPKASGKARYAQMGLFSVEANAKRTLAMLKSNGVSGKIVKSSASDKTFWRVLAGPAETKADQDKLLSRVKAMGFNDAYLVKG